MGEAANTIPTAPLLFENVPALEKRDCKSPRLGAGTVVLKCRRAGDEVINEYVADVRSRREVKKTRESVQERAARLTRGIFERCWLPFFQVVVCRTESTGYQTRFEMLRDASDTA